MVACLYSHILLYLVSFSYVFELGASPAAAAAAAAFTSGQLPRRGNKDNSEKERGNKKKCGRRRDCEKSDRKTAVERN